MMFVFVDPAFSSMFDGTFEEIHFKAPSLVSGGLFGLIVSALMESFSPAFMFGFFVCLVFFLLQLNVSSYLQLLCLAEDMRTDPADIRSLLRLNGCDIRQSLLQLQFWTRSAGGRHGTRPLVPTGKNGKKMIRESLSF